jgi:hypothetical protein
VIWKKRRKKALGGKGAPCRDYHLRSGWQLFTPRGKYDAITGSSENSIKKETAFHKVLQHGPLIDPKHRDTIETHST